MAYCKNGDKRHVHHISKVYQGSRMSIKIRPVAVAGLFYPAEATLLAGQVQALLENVHAPEEMHAPKALIVPHAGYVYSGAIAASAYARLRSLRGKVHRVVLLGPVHRVPVHGLALPSVRAFASPLGEVVLDTEAMATLADLPQVTVNDACHAQEHALEVHLPFLQSVLGKFKLIPLAVGDASPAQVAEVLERLWGGDETLIMVSSDLSHYLPYTIAQHLDATTAQAVLDLRTDLSHEQACGATPVNGLLLAARNHGLQAELLDLRNSGDTAGDKSRVVGYAAFAFYEDEDHDR
jgi:AmmeMemoRadiSam system protein B